MLQKSAGPKLDLHSLLREECHLLSYLSLVFLRRSRSLAGMTSSNNVDRSNNMVFNENIYQMRIF